VSGVQGGGRRLGPALVDYEDVVEVDRLPRQVTSDGLGVRHGYAARIGEGLWFFFDALLPALAFGRAARMSVQCSSYDVWRAADQVRYHPGRGDVRTLYVTGATLDRAPGEKEQLQRWADGIDPTSAHWHGPTT
jgi:hypothetical protein